MKKGRPWRARGPLLPKLSQGAACPHIHTGHFGSCSSVTKQAGRSEPWPSELAVPGLREPSRWTLGTQTAENNQRAGPGAARARAREASGQEPEPTGGELSS